LICRSRRGTRREESAKKRNEGREQKTDGDELQDLVDDDHWSRDVEDGFPLDPVQRDNLEDVLRDYGKGKESASRAKRAGAGGGAELTAKKGT